MWFMITNGTRWVARDMLPPSRAFRAASKAGAPQLGPYSAGRAPADKVE
jgi:hypothetical protein